MKNQKQINAYNDFKRFIFILAGRRGGKTFLVKEKICKKISESDYIKLVKNSNCLIHHCFCWNYNAFISVICHNDVKHM